MILIMNKNIVIGNNNKTANVKIMHLHTNLRAKISYRNLLIYFCI